MADLILARYALAALGPIGSAGAQFALSLVMLQRLELGAFGSFSLLLVACQFSWGIWSALFCAPLPVLLTQATEEARRDIRLTLLSTSLAAATVVGLCLGGLAFAVSADALASVLVGGYATVALVRWFARADAYARADQARVIGSDLAYSAALLAQVALMVLTSHGSLTLAFGSLLIASLVGLLPLGASFLADQFLAFRTSHLPRYRQVLRDYSRWSVIGVITTEATANAHVYLVTLLSGPAALAALSAPALLTRPINVAINALTDFERPHMARQIGSGDWPAARRSVRQFRLALIGAWLLTGAVILALMLEAPRLLFPPQYALKDLEFATAMWVAIAAARVLWTPDSVLLQGAGAFRPLAMASVVSSGVSIIGVLALLLTTGPLWSLGGLVAGELVYGASVIWLARRESARR